MRTSSTRQRRSSADDSSELFDSIRDSDLSLEAKPSDDPDTRARSSTSSVRRSVSTRRRRPALDEGQDVFAAAPTSTPTAPVPAVHPDHAPPAAPGASTLSSATAQATHTLQRLTDTVRRGVGASADTDAAMLDTMRDTIRPAHAYTATYFVAKLFLLACLVGYTAGLDPEACPCAEDGRKYVILWGGGVVMGLCLVAVALPDVFRQNPLLKAVLMALTFVVLYSVVTYFPMLNALDCACANDWRRWLVEGVVYVVLAVFLLTLVGVVSL